MKRIILFIIVLMFLNAIEYSMYAQESKKMTVAVLDFEGKGISQVEASNLTDRLRNELVKTNAFRVIERGQIDDIMQEQGLQQTGACNTDECYAQVGELLGAERMIGGSFGKVGNTYTVNVRVIDVETASISQTAQRDYKGEIDGLLTVLKDVANELADITPEITTAKKKGGGKGKLYTILGVATAGGVAAALLLLKDDGGGEYPEPPGRPGG